MQMELGLKFRRAGDEFTSDFQFAKDRAGPLFLSRETDLMFVLTAHLKGYKRGNIKIDINEDGSLIGISGERLVKETVVVGWRVYNNDAEIKGFKRAFRIPKGVNLDKIKARFNEDDSTLTITMPKKVKGISGTAIEEVEEKQKLVREGSGSLQIAGEKSPEKDDKLKGKIREDDKTDEIGGKEMPKEEKPVSENVCIEGVRENDALKDEEERPPISTVSDARGETKAEIVKKVDDKLKGKIEEDDKADEIGVKEMPKEEKPILENVCTEGVREIDALEDGKERPPVSTTNDGRGETEAVIEKKVDEIEERREAEDDQDVESPEKRFKLCIPIVAGSTLLLSLVVFVIHIVRSKAQNSRRRD